MRTATSIILTIFVTFFVLQSHSYANEIPKTLTAEQKKEIGSLQQEIVAKKKEVIKKYVEYGVIPKEKGDAMILHIQNRYNQLEKNGFIYHNHKKEIKP